MPYPKITDEALSKAFVLVLGVILIFILLICYSSWITSLPLENRLDETQWGGYSPIEVYQIFDKETGVYYAITENGGICPMYTIEGEVKLVDQGNEYVVHKNLGGPNSQE